MKRWSMVGGLGLMGLSGCLASNPEHCAFGYGDGSCDGEQVCVLATKRASHDGVINGCADRVPDEGFVRAKYGLPTSVEARAGVLDDPRLLRGVLLESGVSEECSEPAALEAELGHVLPWVAEIRRHLEARGRVRRSAFDLSETQIAAFGRFNDEVDRWIGKCMGEAGMGSSGSISGGETNFDTEESGGSSSSTGGEPCEENSDCDSIRPVCLDSECRPCGDASSPAEADAACAGADVGNPVCVDSGCVQCATGATDVCDEQLLLCDEETNLCTVCTEHDQCELGACDVFDGRCFPYGSARNVGPGEEFTTIQEVLDDAAMIGLDEVVIVMHEGGPSFNETIVVNSGAIAFMAADGSNPQWVNTSVVAPSLTVVGDGTRVYVTGVRMAWSDGLGLSLSLGARADIRRSKIVANSGGGILVSNGAELRLQNSFVGGDENDAVALLVNDSMATAMYSTFAAGFGTAMALACNAGASVDVRNSLFVARADTMEIDCVGRIENSAAEQFLGGSNTELPSMTTNWFVNYAAGDLHLDSFSLESDIAMAGSWMPGDPTVDIDGDPRPVMAGPDFAGADIP